MAQAMRRFAIAVLLATAALATVAQSEPLQKESLRVEFDASIAPRALPRERPAPVTVRLGGTIGTADGSRPPALRELSIDFNRAGRLSVEGLPTCTANRLQQTTTEAALAACRGALVGHGSFSANVDFPGAPVIPARGKVLVFNALVRGRPGMLLHLYGSRPVRAAFVLPFAVSHIRKGKFGLAFSTRIPQLASGLGYITELKLQIGRNYGFEGKRRSVLSASCAAPEGFSVGIFELAKARFSFADGRVVTGGLIRACRVR
jgi:hypothetical protein